jgi:hypothetical protein
MIHIDWLFEKIAVPVLKFVFSTIPKIAGKKILELWNVLKKVWNCYVKPCLWKLCEFMWERVIVPCNFYFWRLSVKGGKIVCGIAERLFDLLCKVVALVV